jgi:hypothetical protein
MLYQSLGRFCRFALGGILTLSCAVGLAQESAPLEGEIAITKPLPKFWIGMMGEPVNETLKAQLNIAHGVVVSDVVKDSPAASAGLNPHDIVLSVNDQAVQGIEDFFPHVEQAGDKPLRLSVLRGGKATTIEVQPSQRPDATSGPAKPADVLAWLPNREALRLTYINPGVIVGLNGKDDVLPDDVTVTVMKHGSEPARIEVKQGENSWSTTREKLDELPENVRGWVHAVVGPKDVLTLVGPGHGGPFFGPHPIHVQFEGRSAMVPPRAGPVTVPLPGPPEIENRINRLQEQLKALEAAVDELKKGR